MKSLSAFAVLAILVPAAALAVLGYVSLRQWERSAELLFREQARDMASMVAEKVQLLVRQGDDDLLAALQALLASPDSGPRALDRFLAGVPQIQALYLYNRRGELLHPRSRAGEAAPFAGIVAETAPGFWARGGRRHLVAGDVVALVATLRARDGSPLLAVLPRRLEALRRDVFDKSLAGLAASSICVLLDHRGQPLDGREGLRQAERVAAVPLGEAFPGWSLAVYQPPGTSPRDMVRRQVAIFTGAFALLIVVIVAGVLVTHRLVRRETEIARLKSDFVANVSHDLKTPLSVIRMFGETLEMGRVSDDARRQEYYRVITRESERLSRLIDNVLDFSRIEGGRQTYDLAPTALEPVIRETLEAFGYPLAQHGFKVDVEVAPDLPEVVIDAEAVGQALANLVDNAIKYSGDEKAIRVEARRAGHEVAITVADAGIGIPDADQARIFEKFYRVGRSDTQGRRGSGVGLALVRHVADAHRGRVTVESEPGRGSRFTLWLPLRTEG